MVKIEECNRGNITAGLCNTNPGSPNLATGHVEFSDYGYIVATWSVYTFLIAFALACVIHVGIGIWKRHWWVIWTLGAGCALEAIGWGGRVLSVNSRTWNQNLGGAWQYDFNGFIMQIVCTVIAPTFFSAANYIILGKLINATGGAYSFITARSFAIIFMFADFVCLVIQGTGGGIAGTAATRQGADNGAYIMTAGVILQLVITVLFVILLIDFVRRYRADRPAFRQRHPLPNWGFLGRGAPLSPSQHQLQPLNSGSKSYNNVESGGSSVVHIENAITRRSVWIVVGMLVLTTLLIVIRSIFRSAELTNGWSGPIAVNQALFLGLDAFLMALLVWFYVIVHPAYYLPHQKL